jgi:isopentenyl-diphosphate delta-isomerase
MKEELVVLVDERDRDLGEAPKSRVHRTGERHRAVSVFLFDADGRTLLQRRAEEKYHSPGLWSNTCCGHPRPGESAMDAARRRLREEMGVECELTHVVTFEYRADVGQGLLEHEVDHVFRGTFTGAPEPDAAEVSGFRWAFMAELRDDCQANPGRYSAWLPLALARLDGHLSATPKTSTRVTL